ncbi:hypothetical protein DFQ28_001851 [Apophysomyces sp. BC1034]|nr:hypothetical protein DFQ30_009593 [Apophysomyces sp. BC1015]KAG0183259.1 hypothetical protein DFQ29_007805 [Apophysomyces sp. BC1021]KAG0194050.1 hypothetical protein DFQ28_001851 [Apophysomyces sp. BC1034]
MSFINFPADLPYFSALHDQALLAENIAALSIAKEIAALNIEEVNKKDDMEEDSIPGQIFVDALQGMDNELIRTTNRALAYKSSRSKCVDLSFSFGNEGVSLEETFSLLTGAWGEDDLCTLRQIFQARSIHQGKAAKTRTYLAYGWLLEHHPQTALKNLHLLVTGTIEDKKTSKRDRMAEEDNWEVVEKKKWFKSHGYWKDLLNLLQIYVSGELLEPGLPDLGYKVLNWPRMGKTKSREEKREHKEEIKKYLIELRTLLPEEAAQRRAQRATQVRAAEEAQKQKVHDARVNLRKLRHGQIVQLLKEDARYRALHFTVARLFAEQLKADRAQLEKNRLKQSTFRYALAEDLSLAAKWAPSLQQSHDKHTLIATSIAEVLYPPEQYQGADESRAYYLNKVRDLYRKEYLVPLRIALDCPERRMSRDGWKTIDFSHVPSICMQNNFGHFFKHAPEQLKAYLEQVISGKRSVSGATLQPHELVGRVSRNSSVQQEKLTKLLEKIKDPDAREILKEVQLDLANAQWNTLVQSIKESASEDSATLGSSLAICDLSGSMYWDYKCKVKPVLSAMGLSLVLAALAKPPFNGTIISFSSTPKVIKIDLDSPLSNQVQQLETSVAGYSTNFTAVFLDLLLPIAQKHNLKKEDMVKRVFVFSDMEFDANGEARGFETTYELIERKYREAGYELPEIVWWNLSGERPEFTNTNPDEVPMPVTAGVKGCSMLCGYSASLLKSFLEGKVVDTAEEKENMGGNRGGNKEEKERLSPEEFMFKQLEHESFKDLVVVD